jgi:hypothetical protein
MFQFRLRSAHGRSVNPFSPLSGSMAFVNCVRTSPLSETSSRSLTASSAVTSSSRDPTVRVFATSQIK